MTEATLAKDLALLHPLCHAAFKNNPLYTSITTNEFVTRYRSLSAPIRAGYSIIAEDGNGTIQAFLLAFPDAFDSHRVVLKTIAKHPSCSAKGLMSIMAAQMFYKARLDGCTKVLYAFIHEDNSRSLARSHDWGGQPFREYALYAKRIPS